MTEKWVTEAPPLCYTLNFGDAGDDEVVEGKRGQKKQKQKKKQKKHGNLIVNFNNIHWLRERSEETGPQLPSTPGKLHIHG